MRPFTEKPPLTKDTSFVARTYRTPFFEISWHQHVEHELIFFREGEGKIFIGNYTGDFKAGDIFFIGSNLPHTFQKTTDAVIVDAVVVQFSDHFWGDVFTDMPEYKSIKTFLEYGANGLEIKGNQNRRLAVLMQQLEQAEGFKRILLLCECLHLLSSQKYPAKLSQQGVKDYFFKNKERIDKIFQYSIENFQEQITLDFIAGFAGMSVPAFCNYFKKCAKKTYVTFLNEIRVGHACSLLIDTQKPVETICYESGYNTIANFNKQFFKIKKLTPSLYRKAFNASSLIKGKIENARISPGILINHF